MIEGVRYFTSSQDIIESLKWDGQNDDDIINFMNYHLMHCYSIQDFEIMKHKIRNPEKKSQ